MVIAPGIFIVITVLSFNLIGDAFRDALDPKFIVCDEPVSALDVSIQAQILNLLMDLQETRGLTYLFITHDMSVVKHISNQICVMYLGQMVEKAEKEELFSRPRLPLRLPVHLRHRGVPEGRLPAGGLPGPLRGLQPGGRDQSGSITSTIRMGLELRL